jgi:sec-independent protein translocase protein TatA
LIILGLIAVLLFGSKRLPEIGRSLGTGMRDFKESLSGVTAAKEVVENVQQVQSAMKPTNLAGALVPGVKEMQETVSAAKDLANPLGGAPEAGAAGGPATPPQS